MRWWRWATGRRRRLDIVAGTVDGILNALMLAAGRLLHGSGADWSLVGRVGTATALTTLFVFFMAHYAEERAELLHGERELNLTEAGRLATSRLGHRARLEAFGGALLAAGCGLVGAALALALCLWLPRPRWLGLAADLLLLGLLGLPVARSSGGAPLFWIATLVLGGAGLAWVGTLIDITG